MKTNLNNSRGTSLIEAIVVVLIISFSIFGLLQAFAYGRMFIDKMGIRRQALTILQGGLEKGHNRGIDNDINNNSFSELVIIDKERGINGNLSVTIKKGSESSLPFWDVEGKIIYHYKSFSDSISLKTRRYEYTYNRS